MSQTMKLKDTGGKFRRLIESFSQKKEACVIQDDQNQPVAVVLPIERYESYRAYQRQREADFSVFDRIDKKMKDYDPDFIDAQIDKAVAEVKANARRENT